MCVVIKTLFLMTIRNFVFMKSVVLVWGIKVHPGSYRDKV
jgi:hypothetical protein